MKSTVNIEGMHCGSCAMRIKLELEDLEGVTGIDIDHVKGLGTVEHDESVSIDDIISTITTAGYTATVAG